MNLALDTTPSESPAPSWRLHPMPASPLGQLVHAPTRLSEGSFERVSDDPDDAADDGL